MMNIFKTENVPGQAGPNRNYRAKREAAYELEHATHGIRALWVKGISLLGRLNVLHQDQQQIAKDSELAARAERETKARRDRRAFLILALLVATGDVLFVLPNFTAGPVFGENQPAWAYGGALIFLEVLVFALLYFFKRFSDTSYPRTALSNASSLWQEHTAKRALWRCYGICALYVLIISSGLGVNFLVEQQKAQRAAEFTAMKEDFTSLDKRGLRESDDHSERGATSFSLPSNTWILVVLYVLHIGLIFHPGGTEWGLPWAGRDRDSLERRVNTTRQTLNRLLDRLAEKLNNLQQNDPDLCKRVIEAIPSHVRVALNDRLNDQLPKKTNINPADEAAQAITGSEPDSEAQPSAPAAQSLSETPENAAESADVYAAIFGSQPQT